MVNIYTQKIVETQGFSPLFDDPFFREFFGQGFGFGLPRERAERSLGSGVLIRPDGTIITNYHVIEGAEQITVVLADRREFAADIAAVDHKTDLALLTINTRGETLPHLPLHDSDSLQVGDLVLAIGNPFGVGQTVTSGIVSALARTTVGVSNYQFFIQTDAAINPGNSGGALVTMDGTLVGINTAIFSKSGGSHGIGFATPANMVNALLGSLNNQGKVVRPWFGAGMQPVTNEVAQSLGLATPSGVIIRKVFDHSPAQEAGIEVGDVITALDDKSIADPQEFRGRIAAYPIDHIVPIRILRNGQVLNLTLRMAEPVEIPPRDTRLLQGKHPLNGAEVSNLSPALAGEMNVDLAQSGVIITSIHRSTSANSLGLSTGDILLEINNETITSTKQLEHLMNRPARHWRLILQRGTQKLEVMIGG